MPEGNYPLSIQLMDGDGQTLWTQPASLGNIEVIARNRSFNLPEGLSPLQVQIGETAYLQGIHAEAVGDEVLVDMIWQAARPDGRYFTVFVHLKDEDGFIVDQVDRPPSDPTYTWLPNQVVIDRYHLSKPSPGEYTLAIGLYDSTNGVRLPVYSANGNPLPGDEYLIKVPIP
jgi:hypothetical protein